MGTHNSAWQNLNQIPVTPPASHQPAYADTLLSSVIDTGELTPIGSLNQIVNNVRLLDGVNYLPLVAGFYKVDFELQSAPILNSELITVENGGRPGNGFSLRVFKNGALVGNPVSRPNVTAYSASDNYVYLPSLSVSAVVEMNGVDDVIQLMAEQAHFDSEVSVFGRATIYKFADRESTL